MRHTIAQRLLINSCARSSERFKSSSKFEGFKLYLLLKEKFLSATTYLPWGM